jgi:hypothetical protein
MLYLFAEPILRSIVLPHLKERAKAEVEAAGGNWTEF